MPKNHWSPFTSLGHGIFWIASTLLWSECIPSAVILWHEKIISDWSNWHFDMFNFSPCLRTDSKTLIVHCCNLSEFSPQIIISSWLFLAPSMFSMICAIRCWHMSLAEWIPEGIQRNWYLPVGEFNVSSLELLSSIGIRQWVLLASSLVNLFAPPDFGKISCLWDCIMRSLDGLIQISWVYINS